MTIMYHLSFKNMQSKKCCLFGGGEQCLVQMHDVMTYMCALRQRSTGCVSCRLCDVTDDNNSAGHALFVALNIVLSLPNCQISESHLASLKSKLRGQVGHLNQLCYCYVDFLA